MTGPTLDEARRTLRDVFGLESFRGGQEEVVSAQLQGRDVLSVAPTGSGKSVSYWIPALAGGGLTVVVSPLISLMKDQVDRLLALGVPASFINSSIERHEQWRRLEEAAGGWTRLLYVAPERLSRPGFQERLAALRPVRFVVDEAHCISPWGHDFRPDYRLVGRAVAACGRPPVAAFTATATPQVRADIVRSLDLKQPLISVTGFHRPNLTLSALRCRGEAEKRSLLRARLDPAGGRVIVYCATVASAEAVAGAASGWGFRAAAYHARMGEDARRRVQEAFASSRLSVVAATVAFGMGVDFPDVRQVIHYHLPASLEAYYQEAGRAGRDGLPATCLLLWQPADRELQAFLIERSFEERGRPGGEPAGAGPEAELAEGRRRQAYAKLQLALSYARGRGCRHARIADYFGDTGAPRTCTSCDNCLAGVGRLEPVDPGDVGAALSAVRRLSGRLGASNLAAVLGGRDTRWLRERPWASSLPQFGALQAWSQERLRALIVELIESGLIAQTAGEYPVLTLARAGAEVLAGVREAGLQLEAAQAPRTTAGGGPAPAGEDAELLRRLRSWRAETARARHVPAYVVFNDRTLEELSRRRPTRPEALLSVPGVGPAKLALYGEALLALIG
ncbi:MAG: RecQ family ATP-dependent DNA helicase [Candidatus Dormibacterales bacterium]